MNKMDRDLRPEGQAVLEYLDGEFRVVKGVSIPVEALRYWSVDLQEAYANPAIALKRLQDAGKTPQGSDK
jgi:hypothetical protein